MNKGMSFFDFTFIVLIIGFCAVGNILATQELIKKSEITIIEAIEKEKDSIRNHNELKTLSKCNKN